MIPTPKRLAAKYRCALRGWAIGARQEDSFGVHLLVAAIVIAVGILLRVSMLEWLLLALCIGAVLAAEMFNTALERLARAVTREEGPNVRDALDLAAGAVLCVAAAAKLVGGVIFATRLLAG